MQRSDFHKKFDSPGPVILPVIHVLDEASTGANIDRIVDAGLRGCFLINHDFGIDPFLPIIKAIRTRYPDFWIGLNFLAVTGLKAFPILAELGRQGTPIDAYWADDARIDERTDSQDEAEEIAATRRDCGWDGLYFGGTAFKKQRPIDPQDHARAAAIAGGYMDVVTTSGIATGKSADIGKLDQFRRSLPDRPIALASGITPENAHDYGMVDCFMVATGINIEDDFYTIDPARLARLVAICREMGATS
ncbi:MAG: adenine phosphoribosyltransferase [SAR116 cluster bacterium]|jgi:predicted TIM-barrel enzyme|nr:MAG: adenine phosphoribosyltransferase [SAR116 cluster bacterium]